MKLSNALRQVVNSIKDYVDRVTPKKLSDLEIDMELGAVKTINGNEPDENGNVEIETGSPDALLYTEQSLTDEQKTQARKNIDAADKTDIVQPDWNQNDENALDFIKNRPFYEDTKKVILLEETEYELFNDDDKYLIYDAPQYLPLPSFAEGKTYHIVWDGTTYEVVAKVTRGEMSYNVSLGNRTLGSIKSKFDLSKEPFLFESTYNNETNECKENMIIGLDTPKHTAKIFYTEEEIHHLDPKYIKDMYYETEPIETTVVPETIVEFDLENGDDYIERAIDIDLVVGNTYFVNWNGTTYECVCYDYDGALVIGNNACWGGNSGNGEQFLISNYNNLTAINVYESGAYTVSISILKPELHYVPTKFIKDMYYDNGVTTTEILSEITVYGFLMDDEYLEIYTTENWVDASLTLGATYDVVWDGVKYSSLECYMYDGMVCMGNKNLAYWTNDFEDNGIPFALVDNGGIYIRTHSSDSSHTLSITEYIHDLKQLDMKYLPIIEEVFETVVEIDAIEINGDGFAEIYDPSYQKILGLCKLTIDGSSEIINFVDDEDWSCCLGNSCSIAITNDCFYIEYWGENENPHSVKIEKIKSVIKEEYLPVNSTLIINFESTAENEESYMYSWVADKTFTEVLQAYYGGQDIKARINYKGTPYFLPLVEHFGNYGFFFQTVIDESTYLYCEFTYDYIYIEPWSIAEGYYDEDSTRPTSGKAIAEALSMYDADLFEYGIIFENKVMTFEPDWSSSTEEIMFNFVEGDMYKVIWDGVEYDNLIPERWSKYSPEVGIGGKREYSVYPFGMYTWNSKNKTDVNVYAQTAGEHTFSLYHYVNGEIPETKKLKNKYLPDTIASKEYVDNILSNAGGSNPTTGNVHTITKEEVITLLTETGFISPATTASGDIYTDSDGDVYVM